MNEPQGLGETSTTGGNLESIENSSNLMSSSENVNNENLEKELEKNLNVTETKEDSIIDCVESFEKDRKENSADQKDSKDETLDKNQVDAGRVVELSESDHKDSIQDEEDKYAKHVTYNEEGQAIYTDPETEYKYKWCDDKNEWIPVDCSVEKPSENPYENEHYRWCSTTNQWIPKTETTSESAETETEFYKWNKDTRKWIPKAQSSDVISELVDGVHTYKDKDGAVYFWDPEKNAWFPKIDDDFMARYQMNYGFIDNTSISKDETAEKIVPNSADHNDGNDDSDVNQSKVQPTGSGQLKRKSQPEPPKWFEISPTQNTKVYVGNLPLDITEDEFTQVMSKCGLVMRDPQTQKFKVKLYAEPDGQLKGDGLCDYIKIESVELALNLLDGYDVRGNKITVQRAKFQMRGEYNPALKPKKKKKDKEKILKMKERLFDWRPEKMRGERSKHERVVVLKNLFTPELFDKEVHLIIDYQNDLREECSKCGTVRKIVLYDRHSEGVAQITMSDPDEADIVVQMMNGRFFGKRKLTAEIWDGKTKFKIGESDAEVQQRLNNWDKFLETDGKKGDPVLCEAEPIQSEESKTEQSEVAEN